MKCVSIKELLRLVETSGNKIERDIDQFRIDSNIHWRISYFRFNECFHHTLWCLWRDVMRLDTRQRQVLFQTEVYNVTRLLIYWWCREVHEGQVAAVLLSTRPLSWFISLHWIWHKPPSCVVIINCDGLWTV